MTQQARTRRYPREQARAGGAQTPRQPQLENTIADLRLEVEALSRQVDHLCRALDSSRTIGAAVGIVMQQLHLTQPHAFDFLVAASQHLNVKLHDVAADILETGDLEPALQTLRTATSQ